jgi:hypothetical protein
MIEKEGNDENLQAEEDIVNSTPAEVPEKLADLVGQVFATEQELQDRLEVLGIGDLPIEFDTVIQASDVSHTMQHWHIYRKWNARLFEELYRAYVEGRSDKDPSEFWYKGEIGFFDFYIIPLAKKLKDCGVFGVSSDEYLNYAMKNRQEWEDRGLEVVAGLMKETQAKLAAENVEAVVAPGRRLSMVQ